MGYKFSFCAGCETSRSCDDCLHLAQLEKAEREGRLKILPEPKDGTCGACRHFERSPGVNSGYCKIRKRVRYSRHCSDDTFYTIQSRKACANYDTRKEDNHGKADV